MTTSLYNSPLFKPALPAFWGAAIVLGSLWIGAAQAACDIWTTAETKHVLRSEPAGDARAVKLTAARNEWESFQILLRSDAPVQSVRVAAGELRGPGGAILDAAQARLFRQHQLYLDTGTHRNDAFKADWFPDPLIPFDTPSPAPEIKDARFKAVPFDLPANETHGFWIDIYVPANTPPGDYRGVYRITANGAPTLDVPVLLTVWDFTLPRVSTLVTAFGSPAPRMRDYYRQLARTANEPEPQDWEAIETQCAELLTQHRINATPPPANLRPVAQSDGSYRIPADQVRALEQFVDRYHVNALQIPHPSNAVKDPELESDKMRAWLKAFDHAAEQLQRPGIVFYTYLRDEPNTLEDYRYVQTWGRAVREAKSIVKVLVVEQTWTEPGKGGADSAWGDLYGAVDIWCPLFSLHRPDSAAKRQALGETIWTYTALCQGQPTPWWHIDYPLLNYRAPAWIAWGCQIKGLLYWGGMSYWRQTDDPWTQPPIYTGQGAIQQGRKGIVFNGEGSMVYPARAVGYDGIMPSLRLKALRDAIEDYEYLAMLDRLGKSSEAEKIVRQLAKSWFEWNKDPAAYELARTQLAGLIVAAANQRSANPAKATGPLRVHPSNPRYFTDGSGKVVYLTGSHTWNNFKDMGKTDPPPRFDFDTYLRFLQEHGHNFIRLWTWELSRYSYDGQLTYAEPFPWVRSGPDAALDGKPKFDLNKFDQAYFDRLRRRVQAAGDQGKYVSIMLFEGHGLHASQPPWRWDGHPFHAANNVNGINGDPDGDGFGLEIQTLQVPAITALQEAYVRKVIDTVNDLDNVLYEIVNESGNYSTQWQYHMIRFIHNYEKTKPKQHPVGMTFQYARDQAQRGSNDALFQSPADWISPNPEGGYRDNPPAADGRKVILNDTDHLWGIGGNPDWVWKSFCRGMNPIFMDPYARPEPGDAKAQSTWTDHLSGHIQLDPKWDSVRRAMGHTRRLADRINLASMTPCNDLASTAFCLAAPANEYLVYLPGGGEVTVDLSGAAGRFRVEWIHPVEGTITTDEPVTAGDKRTLKAPFNGDAALYLSVRPDFVK